MKAGVDSMYDTFRNLSISELLRPEGFNCNCGKHHSAAPIKEVIIRQGAIEELPEVLNRLGAKRPYLIADKNTFAAAGEKVCAVLEQAGVKYGKYIFPYDGVEPDEYAVGSVMMTLDDQCDIIVGIGSGVINDISKVVAKGCRRPQIIVCTAPSMDGYASTCASMFIDHLKTSLYVKAPTAIIADIDVIRNAPMRMLQAGVGDMITKANSLAEWEMAGLVNGEYFCKEVCELVRASAEICYAQIDGVANREPEAIAALMEGIIISGIGVTFVNVSGPASGVEHYFSHIWDMRNLQAGKPIELHGIQTGAGTLLALKLYERLRGYTPDIEKANAYARAFNWEEWAAEVRRVYGKAAEKAIENEKTYGKHDYNKHLVRMERLLANWDKVQELIFSMPKAEEMRALYAKTGAPLDPHDFGRTDQDIVDAFATSQEIRDKYVLSRLLQDLGLTEEAKKWVLE